MFQNPTTFFVLCAAVVKMLYVDLDDTIRVVDMTLAIRILQSYGKIEPSKSALTKLRTINRSNSKSLSQRSPTDQEA